MMESESAFEKCKLESEELKIENARWKWFSIGGTGSGHGDGDG